MLRQLQLRHSPHRVAHAFVYTQQAPWSSIAYGLSRAISEPEEAFRQWADAQIVMNASIGLVVRKYPISS